MGLGHGLGPVPAMGCHAKTGRPKKKSPLCDEMRFFGTELLFGEMGCQAALSRNVFSTF